MDDTLRRWLVVAVACTGIAGGALRAQAPPEAETALIAPALSPSPPSTAYDGPDPAAYSCVLSRPGWFVQAEVDVVWPRITTLGTCDPFLSLYDPPLAAANLSWGSAGAVGVGYRTGDENGFLVSFRGASWAGHQQLGRESYGPVGPMSSFWTGGGPPGARTTAPPGRGTCTRGCPSPASTSTTWGAAGPSPRVPASAGRPACAAPGSPPA